MKPTPARSSVTLPSSRRSPCHAVLFLEIAVALPLFASIGFAEEAHPHKAFDRKEAALDKADFDAWRALRAPAAAKSAKEAFEALVARGPSDMNVFRAAKRLGVPKDDFVKLTWDEFDRKTFDFDLKARKGPAAYLAFSYTQMTKDACEVEALAPGNVHVRETWRLEGGAWKLLSSRDTEPEVWKHEPTDIWPRWRSALEKADGRALYNLYTRNIQAAYLRAWGAELGSVQEGDEKGRRQLASRHDILPEHVDLIGAESYVIQRLTLRLKSWITEENYRRLRGWTWRDKEMDNIKATCRIAEQDGTFMILKMQRDPAGWRMSSDLFDDERAEFQRGK